MNNQSYIKIRNGSTVNNNANMYSAYIKVSGQTVGYAISGSVSGVLVFPDDQVITGTDVFSSGIYASAANQCSSFSTAYTPVTLTPSQLEVYIEQGCTFIPEGGYGYAENGSSLTWVNNNSSVQMRNLMPTTNFTTTSVANQT